VYITIQSITSYSCPRVQKSLRDIGVVGQQ
jgi:hypothetical protein